MAEEKNQKPVSTPEQPDLEVHSDDNKIENNETTEKITHYKKQAARSFVLAFTTLIAIIAICIAWFVSNTKVTMTGTSISAENTVPFELASAGERQEPEPTKMPGKLSEGSEENSYSNYIDYETGEEYSLDSQKLYVGTSSLAWHLNGQQNFYPGASGELTFYFIPKQDGLKKVTFQLSLTGYKDTENGNLAKVEDSTWQNLISGHILVFKKWDDNTGYSDWLENIESFEIEAPKSEAFSKNMPYKVTLYWKWPKYFRNYVYNDKFREGDLFTNLKDNADYINLMKFVNEQVPTTGEDKKSKLFYPGQTTYEESILSEKISNEMSSTLQESFSKYYNLADEYIGAAAQYIYVEIAAK